jgi:hypothetical protein
VSEPEIAWSGKYICVKTEGTWEYVSRVRGIGAAVILAIDEGMCSWWSNIESRSTACALSFPPA